MKRNLVVLSCAAAAVLFASCGSTPKAEKKEAQPAAPAETKVEKPAEQPVQPVETVTEKTDNSSDLAKAASARDAAVAAGADKTTPDQFAAVDVLYKSLQAAAETGADTSAGLQDVTARYNALEKYAKALDAKKRVDDLGYASYDQSAYDKGNTAVNSLKDLFINPAATGAQWLEQADTAYNSYNAVLTTAFKKLAKDERTAAFTAKRNADGIKAGVAAKDSYDAAVQEFRAGDSSYSMQNPESAYNHYQTAQKGFETLYNDVSAKRAAAQAAIDAAKQKAAESAQSAEQADKTAPLTGDNIKGIEAEDAVLLEKQEFADPKAAEADVPADITDSEEAK